jgi:4-diphosphocytidyl-2-C-methyl-D-erythritol kinase
MRAHAPAKINLTLEVLARLPDNYHAIRSVVVKLPGLCDVVAVEIDRGATQIRVSSDSTEVPADERNICHRVAGRYLRRTGFEARVSIHIEKKVPIAAGLGGGSSDAASVLMALNRHFGEALSQPQLCELALETGRDIPLFLSPANAALVSGTGEKIDPVACTVPLHVLVVNPCVAVPTGAAYEALSARLWYMTREDRADRARAMVDAMREGALPRVCASLYNDFETVVEAAHPIIKEVKQALRALGADGASMTGSGSTVFGVFATAGRVRSAERALREHYPSFTVAQGGVPVGD